MKQIITLALLALPLIGCASISDHATPVFNLPRESLEFVGATNDPPKRWLGIAYSKAQLVDLQVDVATRHTVNVFDFQQLADREQFNFDTAVGRNERELATANALQNQYVNPLINKASVGLSLLTGGAIGGACFKRRGDLTATEAAGKIQSAGLQDPEEFKAQSS